VSDPRFANGAVIDLKVDNDVELELGLAKRPGAMGTLEIIAQHGGEVPWNWEYVQDPKGGTRPLSPATRELVADLIVMGLIEEIEYVTSALQLHGRLTLKLTGKGRNIVEVHRKRKVVASEVKPIVS
jgi:hypothetical protein